MSETMESLRVKIKAAGDLQSVVRTMKALAASSIGQYEKSVQALSNYYRTVELGLGAAFRAAGPKPLSAPHQKHSVQSGVGAIVFGSDQGLVGQFNEQVATAVQQSLAALPGDHQVWAVGARVRDCLVEIGVPVKGLFNVPASITAIAPLVGQIQIQSEAHRAHGDYTCLYLFHNRPQSATLYEPCHQRLLPLDEGWRKGLAQVPWPGHSVPEVLPQEAATLRVLIREYLFICLFRACAESLASENASRLASMQRADKNINDLLEELHSTFHRVRQTGIDEELFDVISGFDALSAKDTIIC